MRPHTAAATTVPSSIPAGVRRPRTAAEMSLPPEDDMSVAAAPAGDGAEVDEAPLDEYNEPRLASCSESLAILLEISNILNTGLDRQTLTILLQLLDTGLHPDSLAAVVMDLRSEVESVRLQEQRQLVESQQIPPRQDGRLHEGTIQLLPDEDAHPKNFQFF
eukprot:GHVT01102057.1.p2 GENE.GHVT01102057.1~~GHVT01102057.1.p2  ORF type:complete len:162 (+),score=41.15 GHVT01102057.1:1651-2136(+)